MGLEERETMLQCPQGHAFDIARQGYVNLLMPSTHTGTADTPEMVAAREESFAAGHLQPLIERVSEVVAEVASALPGCCVDAGAGTGAYLAAALDRLPDRCGIALDLSKHAMRRAARAHERIGAVVCDVWGRLPLLDGSAAVVLSAFAPRNAAEFARVLSPGASVVVVAPTARHLASLVEPLGLVTVDRRKSERLEAQLSPLFERQGEEEFEREVELSAAEAESAIEMGPSARHVDLAALRPRLAMLGAPIRTAVSVTIGVWRRREEP